MIHEIALENFLCVADQQIIDLRVARNVPEDDRFRRSPSRSDTRLPTVVGLFGPNASGKSTIIRAITAMVAFATRSFDLPVDSPPIYFLPHASREWSGEPTRLSVQFDASWLNERFALFEYSLVIGNKDGQPLSMLEESLQYQEEGSKFRRVFERKGDKILPGDILGIKQTDPRLLSVRPNCSVIAALAKFNHTLAMTIWSDLNNLQSNLWGFGRVDPDPQALITFYARHPEALAALNAQLARIDVGLEEMAIASTTSGPIATFRHEGLARDILFHEESRGTQRFVTIFPQLFYVLQNGHIALVDEIDGDLHPLLMPEIFRWFHDPKINLGNAQLFMTAHNAAIMDDLEKEEVFFTEKRGGKTVVFGAKDIKGLRREPSLSKKYLGGLLGAVPRVG